MTRTVLVAALIVPIALVAVASASTTATVTFWLDASVVAPSDAEAFAVKCDVALPAGVSGIDAALAAEADGCADFAFVDFGFGQFVDCVNDACTDVYDPSGNWLAFRFWSLYLNCAAAPCAPSNVGLSDYVVADGDVILLGYELNTWAGGNHNPATLAWVHGLEWPEP